MGNIIRLVLLSTLALSSSEPSIGIKMYPNVGFPGVRRVVLTIPHDPSNIEWCVQYQWYGNEIISPDTDDAKLWRNFPYPIAARSCRSIGSKDNKTTEIYWPLYLTGSYLAFATLYKADGSQQDSPSIQFQVN